MKSIDIQYFRCFEHLNLQFRPGINLLVGDNASGKTSLLNACKYALSAFFAGFSDENTRWMSFKVDDFTERIHQGVILPDKPVQITFDPSDYWEPTAYWPQPEDLQGTYLKKKSRKSGSMLLEGLKAYKNFATIQQHTLFSEHPLQQRHELPLFAYYSTEDIHSNRKLEQGKFKGYSQKNSFGYYECLNADGFLKYWLKRLLILEEGKQNLQEIQIVKTALLRTFGETGSGIIQDVEIRPLQSNVYFILSDGREVRADYLSDGYRRAVNIVIDLAFRCALLNRMIYGDDSCARTIGTVLIDEVDLHLHPSLQASFLSHLQHTFPRLQIIATTHAPLVMSGVRHAPQNCVYQMRYSAEAGYTVQPVDTYGMDMSAISEHILQVTPRDPEVDAQLTHLFQCIDDERYEEARGILMGLRENFSDRLPELSKAETLLDLME